MTTPRVIVTPRCPGCGAEPDGDVINAVLDPDIRFCLTSRCRVLCWNPFESEADFWDRVATLNLDGPS